MAITVAQLNTFLAVIETGSVTAAAERLVVTQPSVSSAISALGRELGCELFERAGRGIRPSAAATAFVPYAADVVGLLRSGRAAAREAAQRSARRLRIIAVTTAAESFVPPLMRAFSQSDPGVELTLDVDNRSVVLDRILTHGADVAVLGRPPADERLAAVPLRPNEIACIAAADDPAAGSTISAAQLAGRPWLLREPGSGTRALNERFLAERGLTPTTLTVGSNGAIRQAARSGLGVSLISRDAVTDELEAGRLGEISLLDGPSAGDWFVVRSSVGPTREVVRAFVTFCAEQASQPGG